MPGNVSVTLPTTPTTTNNGVIKAQLTEKDVSRLWVNDDIKLKKLISQQPQVRLSNAKPNWITAVVLLF